MAQNHKLISQINNNTKNWTCRITITESIPSMTCANGSKLKRYVMADNEGNEIVATIFDPHVAVLEQILHQFQVYDISNAKVKLVDQQYKILPNPYQWILQKDTLIQPAPQQLPTLRYFLDTLTPFTIIARTKTSSTSTFDIMGVVVAYQDPESVPTQTGSKNVQRFTFINSEKIPLCVTLWGEMVESQGPTLIEAAKSLSVVVAKRLSLSTYKSTSLSTKNCSSFTIDPPLEDVTKLKEWIQTRTDTELADLLVDKSLQISRELVSQGNLKMHSLNELKQISVPGEYWVRAYLNISDEYQKLFYYECSNCRAKISANEENTQYKCLSCNETVVTKPRPYVLMTILHEGSECKVIAFDDVAERILQTTATNISHLYTIGEQYDLDSIKMEFEGKIFQALVRRTFVGTDDSQRKMILLAYYEDSNSERGDTSNKQDKESQTSSPNKGKSVETSQSSLSPLKRQIRDIHISSGTSKRRLFQLETNDSNTDESSSGHTDATHP